MQIFCKTLNIFQLPWGGVSPTQSSWYSKGEEVEERSKDATKFYKNLAWPFCIRVKRGRKFGGAFLGTSQEWGDEPRERKEEEQKVKQHKNKAKTKCKSN